MTFHQFLPSSANFYTIFPKFYYITLTNFSSTFYQVDSNFCAFITLSKNSSEKMFLLSSIMQEIIITFFKATSSSNLLSVSINI